MAYFFRVSKIVQFSLSLVVIMPKAMRKILVILLVIFSFSGVKAQEVTFYKGSAFEALRVAQAGEKLLLVEFYASWNRKSEWMHNIIKSAGELNEKFIVVSVDTSSEDGALLAQQYSVSAYPFLVLFDTKGDAIEKIDKTFSKEDFVAKINEIVLNQDKNTLWQLQTILRAVANPSLSEEDYARVLAITSAYLASQSRDLLVDQSHWGLFSNSRLTFYGSDCYDFLTKNYSDFFDAELAEEYAADIIYSLLLPLLTTSGGDDLIEMILSDSTALAIAPAAESLTELIALRRSDDAAGYTALMEKVAGAMPEKYEYQLVITLSFVAHSTSPDDRKVRAKARTMLEKLQQHSLSGTKISLIESLLQEF